MAFNYLKSILLFFLIWSLSGFCQCLAEEIIHHASSTSPSNEIDYCHEEKNSPTAENQQKHIHLCHSSHSIFTLKSQSEITTILSSISQKTFSIELNVTFKDIFLDGPFHPPRSFSFS